MPCPCRGTTGGASCMRSCHSRWSLKFCRRSLSHQESGWFWSLNCNWQRRGFRSWWICPKKIRSRCSLKVKTCWLKTFWQVTGWPRLVTSGRQIYTRGNSTGHMFRVRSHHFSSYMMHLFRDELLPSMIISHRTSVASVLRHWVYDPAADSHIKLLIRAFRLERPVQRRIMPKWDLHLVLLSLLRPPFASDGDVDGESSDDVIPLKWWTMKCVFLLALALARRRSYLHSLSVVPGRCVFARGNTHQRMFIHGNRNIRDIMRSHISRWIVETVKEAYTLKLIENMTEWQHMSSEPFQHHGRTTVR